MIEREPLDADLVRLAREMRWADTREMLRLGWPSQLDALRAAVGESLWSRYVETDSGDPLVCFGLACDGFAGADARPWALTGAALDMHKLSFMKRSHEIVAEMAGEWPRLSVLVDDDHRQAVRWLTALGFSTKENREINGKAFRVMERNGHV